MHRFYDLKFDLGGTPTAIAALLRTLAISRVSPDTLAEAFKDSDVTGWAGDDRCTMFDVTDAQMAALSVGDLGVAPLLYSRRGIGHGMIKGVKVGVYKDEDESTLWAAWRVGFRGLAEFLPGFADQGMADPATPAQLFAQIYATALVLNAYGHQVRFLYDDGTMRRHSSVVVGVVRSLAQFARRPWGGALTTTAGSRDLYALAETYLEHSHQLPMGVTDEDDAFREFYLHGTRCMAAVVQSNFGLATVTEAQEQLAWLFSAWAVLLGSLAQLNVQIDSELPYGDVGAQVFGLHFHDIHGECVYVIVKTSLCRQNAKGDGDLAVLFRLVDHEEYVCVFGEASDDSVDPDSLRDEFDEEDAAAKPEDDESEDDAQRDGVQRENPVHVHGVRRSKRGFSEDN